MILGICWKNLFEAKNREMFKRSKKEIHKIFEDDNYMIFKPLTYASSCSYGYQTKWCTAMVMIPVISTTIQKES
jgi:hypothetical protein